MSGDFAVSKPAGLPCPNLLADHRCGIHVHLRDRGFPGCTAFDCFGAGQRVVQVTFAGRDRRDDPGTAADMFAVFGVMRQLHELLWYLAEAASRPETTAVHAEADRLRSDVGRAASGDAASLLVLDVETLRRAVVPVLRRAGDLVRSATSPKNAADADGPRAGNTDLAGADLAGADLRAANLRGSDLRGACLIGADLTGADLAGATLTGADLRHADLAGADLATVAFLTRFQIGAARGNARTRLPAALERPAHWTARRPG